VEKSRCSLHLGSDFCQPVADVKIMKQSDTHIRQLFLLQPVGNGFRQEEMKCTNAEAMRNLAVNRESRVDVHPVGLGKGESLLANRKRWRSAISGDEGKSTGLGART